MDSGDGQASVERIEAIVNSGPVEDSATDAVLQSKLEDVTDAPLPLKRTDKGPQFFPELPGIIKAAFALPCCEKCTGDYVKANGDEPQNDNSKEMESELKAEDDDDSSSDNGTQSPKIAKAKDSGKPKKDADEPKKDTDEPKKDTDEPKKDTGEPEKDGDTDNYYSTEDDDSLEADSDSFAPEAGDAGKQHRTAVKAKRTEADNKLISQVLKRTKTGSMHYCA